MSTDIPSYPQPRPSPINQAHLDAWRNEGKLLIQQCGSCDHAFYYPRPFCPKCFAEDVGWVTASGHGTVILKTLIHRPNHPAFFDEVPIVLTEIQLPEGPRLIARIVGADRANAMEGSKASLVSKLESSRYPLPTFTLTKVL